MTNNKQDHIGEANKMVTAVEWLIDELIKNHGIQANLYSEFEQAKEMEKEQKISDFTDGYLYRGEQLRPWLIDKWYEETYGDNK